MKIEVGKKYNTRHGRVAEITESVRREGISTFNGILDCMENYWTEDGKCLGCTDGCRVDLVSEYIELCPANYTQIGGDHYTSKAIQPIDYIHANELGFCEGNVVKYVTRHKDKNGKQDIEKAIHYLQLILQQQYS